MSSRRVALVTGASTGIGAAVAVALAQAGYDVALCARSRARLADTEAQVRKAGARAVSVEVDVRDVSSIRSAFQAVVHALGRVDVLVNNAGIILRKPALEATVEEWDDLMNTNLRGAFFFSQEFARHLVAEGRPGQIVNMSSTHGLVGLRDRSIYAITKAALIHMTKVLALEWADKGIRVNAVAPATVLTESREQALSDPKTREAMLARIPAGRFATPEEVAAAVCYLVDEKSDYITGHTLVMDGGLTLW